MTCSTSEQRLASLNHLFRSRQQRRRHRDAERAGGLEIDRQLVLDRRLHRQVGGLLALEDAINVPGRASVLVDQVRPVGDEADPSYPNRARGVRFSTSKLR